MPPLNLAVVDHAPLYRRGLCSVLAAQTDFRTVFETQHPHELLQRASQLSVQVLVIVDDLPLLQPLELVREFQRFIPSVPSVVLSGSGHDSAALQAINAGAAAFLRRDCSELEVISTVRAVAAGHHPIEALATERPLLAHDLVRSIREGSLAGRRRRPGALSSREVAVLEAVAAGLTNQDIGVLLSISPQTVKNHMTSILAKLAAKDRTAAVMTALHQGWLRVPLPAG